MRITGVKITPVEGNKRLLAYAVLEIDGCFVIKDIKIIKGDSGFFVAMPSKKLKSGIYKDLAHPLNRQTRDLIEIYVLAEYNRVWLLSRTDNIH